MAETSRDLFASRLGMLAATLGSSVGLGNIWKFPALTGEQAFFIRIDLMYSTGDILVNCLIFR